LLKLKKSEKCESEKCKCECENSSIASHTGKMDGWMDRWSHVHSSLLFINFYVERSWFYALLHLSFYSIRNELFNGFKKLNYLIYGLMPK
jgi:hypothetical protein